MNIGSTFVRTRFVDITSRIHQKWDRIFPFFFQMCTQMRFSGYVATLLEIEESHILGTRMFVYISYATA